jgi:hypothetical protein
MANCGNSIERLLDYIMKISEVTINLGYAVGELRSSLDESLNKGFKSNRCTLLASGVELLN